VMDEEEEEKRSGAGRTFDETHLCARLSPLISERIGGFSKLQGGLRLCVDAWTDRSVRRRKMKRSCCRKISSRKLKRQTEMRRDGMVLFSHSGVSSEGRSGLEPPRRKEVCLWEEEPKKEKAGERITRATAQLLTADFKSQLFLSCLALLRPRRCIDIPVLAPPRFYFQHAPPHPHGSFSVSNNRG
jgi:hypothetical protein